MSSQDEARVSSLGVRTHGLVQVFRADGHDVAALAGVDLTVAPGERVALLGPSGAGKSTLLSLFGGLMRPSAGTIHVGEHALAKMSEAQLDALRASEVGIVLQGADRNLLPWLSARGNVESARAGRTRVAVDEVLDLVGLGDGLADTPLSRLTPGQRQLAALATALASGPGLLLADEPTSQLDADSRDVVLDAVEHVNATLGTTVLAVTHDPEVARRFPRTVTIRDGRVGGEGREGEEFSVVAADGSLPLPPAVVDDLPPGTLVRVHAEDGRWVLLPQTEQTEQEDES